MVLCAGYCNAKSDSQYSTFYCHSKKQRSYTLFSNKKYLPVDTVTSLCRDRLTFYKDFISVVDLIFNQSLGSK